VISKDLAWLSFPIALLFLNWLDLFIFRGIFLYKNLAKERINLNLNAAGIKSHSFHKILILRVLLVSVLSLSGFIYFMKDDSMKDANKADHQKMMAEGVNKSYLQFLSMKWEKLDGKAKEKYEKLSEEDNKRYQQEMLEYNEKFKDHKEEQHKE
jgi:hypothetical protein